MVNGKAYDECIFGKPFHFHKKYLRLFSSRFYNCAWYLLNFSMIIFQSRLKHITDI